MFHVVKPMATVGATICALLRGDAAPALWREWPAQRWDQLVNAAASHGVAGLVQRALAAGGWQHAVPPAAREALRQQVYAAAGHNVRAYQVLAEVLALASPNTPLVVLKGAALGPSLYPTPALRPLTDVDLLAPPEAVAPLGAALERCGFRPKPAIAPELARAVEPHLALLGGPAGAVPVELHWGLLGGHADWRAAPLAWFWEQTEPWLPPATLATQLGVARQLTPTAALLYQAAHLVLQHGQETARLIWLYDLHLLARHPRLDWPVLCAQANVLGWGAVLRTALEQVARCFGLAAPRAALAELRSGFDRRVRFTGPDQAPEAPYTSWSVLGQLGGVTRLRLLLRLAVPNPAYLRAQYAPRWGRWWPLAYPYRWLLPLRRLIHRR
jgi:hypothetical protein